MAKKIDGYIKLQIAAGQANPSPPVGPALGQRGINIMEFCKAFNAKTGDMEAGAPCPTIIEYFQDKSFTMVIKTPPASFYIKKAAKLKSGANCLRPYHDEHTRSRLITEVKHRRARIVLGWGTAWEHLVP